MAMLGWVSSIYLERVWELLKQLEAGVGVGVVYPTDSARPGTWPGGTTQHLPPSLSGVLLATFPGCPLL